MTDGASGASTPGTQTAASLIVVNFNGAGRITRCVESLLADSEPAREVIIVDNASNDASGDEIALLEQRFEGLRVVRSPENLGYAGAVNAALPLCRARHVGVLNMDLEAEPGWLAPLVELLDERPDAGAVNPLLALANGTHINAAGQDIHVTGLGFNRDLGRRREDIGALPRTVSGIQGAVFLVRRELLERMGGMDTSGFLYHEDVNLSWLLRMMGNELYCAPASVVRHDYFLSMYPRKLHLLERNRWSLLLSYLEPTSLLLLAPALAITELMLWGYALLRGPSFVSAKATSYAWLWRTREARRSRRALAGRLRVRGDREVLRHLHWRYHWRQFALLAGERGASERRIEGRPPADT